jgi:hypothetical protein
MLANAQGKMATLLEIMSRYQLMARRGSTFFGEIFG